MIKSIKNFLSEEYAIYKLSYKTGKRNNVCKTHIITKPVDILMLDGKKIGFRSYSFGRGVRKFLDFRVVSLDRIYKLPDVEARKPMKYNERVENLSEKTLKNINEHLLKTAAQPSKTP